MFSNNAKIPLPIRAGFHADHMTQISPEKLLECMSSRNLAQPVVHSLFFSPSTGEQYMATSLSALLAKIVDEILRVPILLEESIAAMSQAVPSLVKLVLFGPSNASNSIKRSMLAQGLRVEIHATGLESNHTLPNNSDAIAIVGMAARLPGSETLEELWEVLEEGRDLHEKIRPDRFNVSTHCDPSGKLANTSLTEYGVFIDRPGFFDTRLFNMSPREASQTDPQQRLLLLATYEALEMAGYSPNRTPSTSTRRIGSFIGQTSDDYREVNASQNIDTYFITGGIRAFGPGRLNYHFGWEGPSFSLDTACSSSAASIQLACSALLARECDTAIGGGVNFLSSSDLFAGLSRGSFLSKTGGCKTFDEDADGYVRADGVGVVVLKRLDDAIADRDNIQAVLRAAVTNHSAEAVSITHPHAATQERLFQAVLNRSGVTAQDIDYVELHGTGTQAGDATESRSATSVFSQGRTAMNPLYIGTVKPNLGHGEAASGVTSLIKAIMMLRKNMIPPHVGIKGRMNENLPKLAELNTHISFGKTAFFPKQDGDGKRRIIINNFDAAGGNTSMLLEDPPLLLTEGLDPRGYQVVTISAKTTKSMLGNMQRLLQFLKKNPAIRLEDVAYTTTARRMHHVLRQSYTVSSLGHLIAKLEKDVSEQCVWRQTASKPEVVFVFTGQGSQYTSMASQLFRTHSVFRQTLQDYDAISILHGFASFLSVITDDKLAMMDASPVQIQLAIVSIELAMATFWKSLGVHPSAVIGHSLGEYAALCVAGVLSVSDTLYLVGTRATLISSQCTSGSHSMLAVEKSCEDLQLLLSSTGSPCEISCINSPTSTVVSGPAADIHELHQVLQSQLVRSSLLGVQFAFHSAQLDSVLDAYAKVAENAHFSKPTVPIASTLLGDIIKTDGIINAQYLSLQARKPVEFVHALFALKAEFKFDSRTVWIETGPNPTCLGFVKATLDDAGQLLPSLKAKQDDWKTLATSVGETYCAGINVNWSAYHRPYETTIRLLELPNYAFDLKNYWIQYEGDWSIRKGALLAPPPPPEPVFQFTPTTSLHRIVSEIIEPTKITIKFATDACEPKLHRALRGHLVNGAGLCPSTVYADMAFTAASYVQQLSYPKSELCMDVNSMSVHKPLLIHDTTQQVICVTLVRETTSDHADIKVIFSSEDGTCVQEHAHCIVSFGDGEEWKSEWTRTSYLMRTRIDQLQDASRSGSTHRILRPMAYKLFKALVDYDDKYQGMQEVYMDSNLLEATAKVQFRTVEADGSFMFSPYWLDSFAHLSGFVLNAAETTGAHTVYISHGWGSMKVIRQLSAAKTYQSYVRMQETRTHGVMAGDVYFYEGDEVVAVCKDLRFQQIKRSILDHLLPPTSPRGVAQVAHPVTKNDFHRARTIKPATREANEVLRQSGPSTAASMVSKALGIIASEVGVDVSELTDETIFADLGIDSLLTISIQARFFESLDKGIPTNLLFTYGTVKELRAFLMKSDPSADTPEVAHDESDDSSNPYSSAFSTGNNSPDVSITPDSMSHISDEDSPDALKVIFSSEVGVSPDEITEDTVLTELGIDSLLSLSILNAIKIHMGRDLPANFLYDHHTFGEVREALRQPRRQPGLRSPGAIYQVSNREKFAASSILLQGTPSPGNPSAFLFPDGSGSAGSYVGLPLLNFGGVVYGLNSPFLSSAEDFTCSLQEVVSLFVAEIRRVQPHGPYSLGGWSIGGSYAFEAASQLAMIHGEKVLDLILIDAPCPKTLPPLPISTIDILEELDIFDGAMPKSNAQARPAMRKALRAHFAGSVNALKLYKPVVLRKTHTPDVVTVIWAKHGVWETVDNKTRIEFDGKATSERANLAHDWIMDKRSNFDSCGWQELMPAAKITCKIIDGTHFSIMRKPRVNELGRQIASALHC